MKDTANGALTRLVAILNQNLDLDDLLLKACNEMVIAAGARAGYITFGGKSYESNDYFTTEHIVSFHESIADDLLLELHLFFLSAQQDNSTSDISLMLRILTGEVSKRRLSLLLQDNRERVKELNGINQTASIIGKEVSIRETLAENMQHYSQVASVPRPRLRTHYL